MAAQTVFSVGMFPVGVSLMEDAQSLNEMNAPQLVMLANMAAVTSAESNGVDGSAGDEKEMMELKTVGCSYSDSEDENIIRYSFDNQNHREVCIIEYPESPGPSIEAVVLENPVEEEEEEDDDGNKAEDLSHRTQLRPSTTAKTPEQVVKCKVSPAPATESSKKKKPFHCKPCHFQAQNEREFVEHLGTHGVSKMMVVNRVEGRSKNKSKEVESPGAQDLSGGEAEISGEAGTTGDIKGLIRCERCGYNTNRYDHYIAHLKHHSKEGVNHRVFKCTLCPYTTVSQYHWRKHLRNHFPSKLHTCSQCSYFSDRKSNYIQHIRTHTGLRPFQCLYCDYSSSQKTHLTRHMRTHSGERPFKCESCDYLAANQHEVTRHTRQVHNGPKPLSCPYCEYKTADRSNFKKHVELHLNPRQFLCPLCKYAASKKCNLQYHIKSRHSGCDVSVDISKVKLRVKKPGHDSPEEAPRANKVDNSSSADEDFDMDEDDGEEEMDSSPINLSIRISSPPKNSQSEQSEAPEKASKKSNMTAEREKVQKLKEPDRKVTTRQKKTENLLENLTDKETQTGTPSDNKTKRRVKKTTTSKDQTPEKDQTQTKNSEEGGAVRKKMDKDDEETKPVKEKEPQKNESSGKENKNLSKPRKSGTKKVNKIPEHVEEAQQNPDSPDKIKKEKGVKEKASKRKAMEALDLSKKAEAETSLKAKRVKSTAAEKRPINTAEEDKKKTDGEDKKKKTDREDTKKTNEVASKRTDGEDTKKTDRERMKTNGEDTKKTDGDPRTLHISTRKTPNKQKRTRNTKRAADLQQAVETEKDKDTPVKSQITDMLEGSAQPDDPSKTTTSEPHPSESTSSEPHPTRSSSAQENKPTQTAQEATADTALVKMEVSPSCSSGEDTRPPAKDPPTPTFIKPMSPPPLVLPGQRNKPADPEDDEGIHSSHEGGSDISDSASEGSDDSGLNSTGANSGKMANDPETPTDEIPTPTELKSHMCIFCDRTFPLEVDYRRHLNRHLVNVYYMDQPAKAQK
uniref:RE1-silencing transcription factor n=1 Tax=Labrus bergylta TaxID=56723 RepID=A0A3Q3G4S2_9LABR|nr:RE1-silencing transcription factor isoform X1 [Labrus bergylta]